MTRHRCLCRCHELVDDTNRADGVDVRDPLHAVSACADCQNAHVAALSDARDAQAETGATGGDATGYAPTDNGEGPYLAPKPWTEEDGG